jgi:ADP-ribose pyrophosphatase YjhB (NUDIX family)
MGSAGSRAPKTGQQPPRAGRGPDFEHPLVTVDLVIFTVRNRALNLLVIRRGEAPFEGMWALPGGFVRERESLEETARRELEEETGGTKMDGVHRPARLYRFSEARFMKLRDKGILFPF